jgi:hypothetical protein
MNKDEREALEADHTRGSDELAQEVALGCREPGMLGQYDEYYEEDIAPADGGPFVTDIRPAYPQSAYPQSSYPQPAYPASSYPSSSYPASSYQAPYSPYGQPGYPYGTALTSFSASDPNQTIVNQVATTLMRGQRQWSSKLLRHILKKSRRAILRNYRQTNRPLPADHARAEARWRLRYFASQNGIVLPANVSLSGDPFSNVLLSRFGRGVSLERLRAMPPSLKSKVQRLIAAGRIRIV